MAGRSSTLSDLAGLTVRTIQRLEAGESMSLETLRLTADSFGVSVSSLFDDVSEDPKANKIEQLDQERSLQIQHRKDENILFRKITWAIFITIAVIIATIFGYLEQTGALSHNDIWEYIFVSAWVII
ncbi:helix-turn-helix domain-containing protein [Alloscardovia venturai]|uniref:Helix-turn-helix domain-containing protein n=1 Tax=Alloscardovia venturai TaxID=1769421 RepID=A0ABW2Y2W5_9BIFI